MTLQTEPNSLDRAFTECAADVAAVYERARSAAPNYAVSQEDFARAVRVAAEKYLRSSLAKNARSIQPTSEAEASDITSDAISDEQATPDEAATDESDSDVADIDSAPAVAATDITPDALRQFVGELQVEDLHLALACLAGNEAAWWDFDQTFRRYIERISRHLASAETDAEEVVDFVYTELYGTRVVEGVRQSKFATYTGRGNLRGWLRAVVYHAVIDMHRARRDEISVEDWSAAGGETDDRPGFRAESQTGEAQMIQEIAQKQYGDFARQAIAEAFRNLDDHEKLLLLYYHVENLKLREIARLVEQPESPLRRWFQRQSKSRRTTPEARVHESTVMRWLEKVYANVHENFLDKLKRQKLSKEEIELCMEVANESFAAERLPDHLRLASSATNIAEAGSSSDTNRSRGESK